MTKTLSPGCNMPCLPHNPERPDLFFYEVTALEDGTLVADFAAEGTRVTDEFAHLVFFPTYSLGRIGYYTLKAGQTVRVEAAADNTLRVTSDLGVATFPNQILVLAHRDIEDDLTAYYGTQEA